MSETTIRCKYCRNWGTVDKRTYKCSTCGGQADVPEEKAPPAARPGIFGRPFVSTYSVSNMAAATYGVDVDWDRMNRIGWWDDGGY